MSALPSPDALPAAVAAPLNLQAPRLIRRMACWMYEGILMFGVVFIAGYLFGTLSQTRNAMDNRHALQAFLFVVFGIYFTWFWAKGQTLAMKTWHIRVVDHQGQPTEQYPQNPNGSPGGLTAVTTADGRFTAMMPHPERVFRNIQMSWTDGDPSAFSPWMQIWRNARRWVG